MLSIQQMREDLRRAYPHGEMAKKLDTMRDSQIIAMHMRLSTKKGFKK